jgi:hypothetical protein
MQGIMIVYAIFAGLIILVVLCVLVASGISAVIDAYRRAFGKRKPQQPAHAESRHAPGDSPRA